MTARIILLVLSVSLLLLTGCGGGQKANPPETTAQTASKTVVGNTTNGPSSTPGQTGLSGGEGGSQENYCIEKQFAAATQGMSQAEISAYETGVINEAVARGVDPRTVLAERGFIC